MTTIKTPTASTSGGSPQRLSALAMAGLLAGPFLSMVDSNVVNVGLPDIATQLHASLTTAQWVISGYLLALAAGLAASAYLAKRFGTRRVYLVSLIGFTVVSALCALAPTIAALVALRVAQGALGATLVPLAMNMLLGGQDGGAETRGQFPAAAGILLFLAPALGPTIGGLLIRLGGWPLIFLVNVPFGLIGALGVLRVPPDMARDGRTAVRFDPLGLVMLGAGLALASYGASEGPQRGWGALETWPYLASGGALLVCYTVWALVRPHPAVDLKLLRHGQTALAVALCALASVVMFVMLVLIPIVLEDLQGHSALEAGLALLPQGLVTGVGVVLGDRLAPRWGVRASATAGLLLLTLTTASLLVVGLDTPVWVTALLLSGRGLAVGLTIQPLLMGMLEGLTPSEVADGNTLFNVAERLGGSFGIALLITFFTERIAARVAEVLRPLGIAGGLGAGQVGQLPPALRAQLGQAALGGFHDTIWLLVAIAAVGCGAALLLRGRAEAAGQTSGRAENAADEQAQALESVVGR